jgi:hypothetical protein
LQAKSTLQGRSIFLNYSQRTSATVPHPELRNAIDADDLLKGIHEDPYAPTTALLRWGVHDPGDGGLRT